MAQLAQWVESIRALPEHRAKFLVELERAGGISLRRRRRLAHIVDRYVYLRETPRALCAALGISRQQFYTDLREGLTRLRAMLGKDRADASKIVLEDPRRAVINQAGACYQTGASLKASELLQRLRAVPLTPSEASEVAALEFDVFEDLEQPAERYRESLEYLQSVRARLEIDGCDDGELAVLDATLHWLRAFMASNRRDRFQTIREYNAMTALLRPHASAGDRKAALAFCRYAITGVLLLHEFGHWHLAERDLSQAHALLQARDDLPVAMLAELHAQYAMLHAGSPTTANRSRTERAVAYKLGTERTFSRAVWTALSMEVNESVARGEGSHALACASALHDGVYASDSRDWRVIARSRLALTYNALGRFDEVERLIGLPAVLQQPYQAHSLLPLCEMLLGRKRYGECRALATRVVDTFGGIHRAAALVYRAQAEYHSNDLASAIVDIKEAVDIYDSFHAHSLFALHSACRTAYLITREPRYRDAVRSVEIALYEDEPEVPASSIGSLRGLTTRQREISKLAADGATNRAIAQRLNISPRTVGNHLDAIYAHFGIRARWQLADAINRDLSA